MSRWQSLLLAHDMQADAAELHQARRRQEDDAKGWESHRQHATDRAAHRCLGCGSWLYSVRPCSTPGCNS